MTTEELAAQRELGQTCARASYTSPVLKEFGPVAALTQAGTGQNREGNGQNMNDTTRRP